MPQPAYTFIAGDDDFMVAKRAQALYDQLAQQVSDEFSREVIDGTCQNASEVEDAVGHFLNAVQTLSMFGDKKVVWFKNIRFLGSDRTSKSEAVQKVLEKLIDVVHQLNPDEVSVILSASNVDRRRGEFKKLSKGGQFEDFKKDENASHLPDMIQAHCRERGVSITPAGMQALIETAGKNTRLILNELDKLASWLSDTDGTIDEHSIAEMVPTFGEGEDFATTEAFYSLNLERTLKTLDRYFFVNQEARPILAALQNRNRTLILVRTLIDTGNVRCGARGVSKNDMAAALKQAETTTGRYFGGYTEKTTLNIFTQNPWYLGSIIAPVANRLPLKKLIDFQLEFVEAFRGIINRPKEHHNVMRELAIRCLG